LKTTVKGMGLTVRITKRVLKSIKKKEKIKRETV